MKDVAFPNSSLHVYEKVVYFESLEHLKLQKKVEFVSISNLLGSHKYYGMVVAKIDLFSNDQSLMKPLKTGRAYYDEFIVVTPKFNLPFKSLVGITIVIGFLAILYLMVKNYVFGDLGKLQSFE